MTTIKDKVRWLLMVITMVITFQLLPVSVLAQTEVPDTVVEALPTVPDDIPDLVPDVVPDLEDELEAIRKQADAVDSLQVIEVAEQGATLVAEQVVPVKQKRDWSTWAPDPKRAL